MPRNRARSRRVERQFGEISEQLRKMQLEDRQGREEVRQGREEVRDFQAQGVQVVKQILTLGDQKVSEVNQAIGEVRGDLYDTNQAFTALNEEFKEKFTALNEKIDRVLEQTSKVQVKED